MADSRVAFWDIGSNYCNVVAAGKAVIAPVLEGRQAFIGIFGGLLQRIAAGRKACLATERELRLESRDRIAIANLFGR